MYTITFRVLYTASLGDDAPTGIAFLYTDGTSQRITCENAASGGYYNILATSAPGKTLDSICMHKIENTSMIFYINANFGVYEGDLSSSGWLEEPYTEPQYAVILLDAPLRSIGYATDIADLTEGIYRRGVEYAEYGSADDFETTDTAGVFLTRLPSAVRDRDSFLSPFPLAEDGEEGDTGAWVKLGEDMESFLLHLPECNTLEELGARLSAEGFAVAYAMRDPVVKHFESSFADADGPIYLSVDTELEPSLFYIEYI